MQLFENVSHMKCFIKSNISQMLKSCLIEFWPILPWGQEVCLVAAA